MKTGTGLFTSVLLSLLMAAPFASFAQQKQHVSFIDLAENSKFTQQQKIEVGDMPNHFIWIFEIHHAYPNNPPMINGLHLMEEWDRGTSDEIDGNGPIAGYSVFVMENGDQFFARFAGVVEAIVDGEVVSAVEHITGGTGTLAGIQGTVRGTSHKNFKTHFSEAPVDIEYSMGK
jgi:hypothetical protein